MKKFFSKKWVRITLLILVLIFIGIQFVPVEKTNPPITQNVKWDSNKTKDLFYRACADCHTNETKWPWYSSVAPVSWLVTKDVKDGRKHLNLSEEEDVVADEMVEEIKSGNMPYAPYLITHSEARLTDQEKNDLLNGLIKTFGLDDESLGEEKSEEH